MCFFGFQNFSIYACYFLNSHLTKRSDYVPDEERRFYDVDPRSTISAWTCGSTDFQWRNQLAFTPTGPFYLSEIPRNYWYVKVINTSNWQPYKAVIKLVAKN